MDKRKSFLYTIVILIIILFIGISYFISISFVTREKLYYVPEINLYLRTLYTPKNSKGYIIINKDSISSLSENIDYIKLNTRNGLGLLGKILIDAHKGNKLYFVPITDSEEIFDINQVDYEIKQILYEGDIYSGERSLPNWLDMDKYFKIYVGERLDKMYIVLPGDSILTEIFPVRAK